MPGFILEVRIATATGSLMELGRRTRPVSSRAVSNIIAKARARIGEHIEIDIAVNRRRVLPLRAGKADKDVVVVLDSSLGR